MKKKIILIILAIMLLISILFTNRLYQNSIGDNSQKEITIILNVDHEEIYNQSFKTSSKTLSEFLIELSSTNKIKLEYEDSEFGMYITGLGVNELIHNDDNAMKYWTYISDNNKSCISDGYCSAASSLSIDDGNIFIFNYATFE